MTLLKLLAASYPTVSGAAVLLWLLTTLLLWLITTRIITWKRLSHVPGPQWNALTYWPMFLTRCRGNSGACKTYATLAQEYGKLVRIGPNDLITSDTKLIRKMSAATSSYGRSSWYKATRLDPYHDMMGSVLDKSAHHSLRTKVRAGYLGTDIPDLEASIDTGIDALIQLISEKYTSTSVGITADEKQIMVDFGRLADLYAMDARSRMSFGEAIGLLREDRDLYDLIRQANLAIDVIQIFTDIPPLQKLVTSNIVLRFLGPKPSDKAGFGRIMGIAREHVRARLTDGDAEEKEDLLGSFLRRGLDPRSAEAETMFPMVAGSDTAAKAIKNTMWLIVSHTNVYMALSHEIDTAIDHGRVSSPSITSHEAQQMPYLQAVIYEALRMRPPFTGLIMKAAGPDGDFHEGTFIPPETRIGHNTWALTHDKDVFGVDVDNFRPERWLEADEPERSAMKRQTELVFGTGRWQCAGKVVAMMELNKIFVQLLRNFHFVARSEGREEHTMVISHRKLRTKS